MKCRLFVPLFLLIFALAARAAEDADALWQEISKAAKPPAPPAEWNQKRPTPEQMREWQKSLIPLCEEIAAKAKKFQETYPDHAKTADAKKLEARFAAQAANLKKAADPTKSEPARPENDPFKKAMAEAIEKIRARRVDGPLGVADELEKQGRALARDFPKEEEPWGMLLNAAAYAPTAKAQELLKDVAENAPSRELKEHAGVQLRKMGAVGKPFALAFTAVDGREVDLAKLKGKVVLIDFWATWCGPCIAELPNVKAAYKELHGQGFEILGISLDDDEKALKRFVAKEEMTWPQYFDGLGWKNKISSAHGINSIPAMYLVDKKGVLRDMNAREGLKKKIEDLLAE